MRIHYLQHVDFEDPAEILNWASQKKHDVTCTRLYNNEGLPDIKDFDALVVMGGPMSTNEEDAYPWLKDEKKFIKESIRHEKIVLGICLGAQLIADVEGSRIFKNKYKEIGWFPVEIKKHPLLFPNEISSLQVFHWHGDTF
ncbi:MAG: type 1 glutamine amidotransferase, partial [Spirochaetes bacterium]|nr:type 1 glutamine amidotransferase [Spirochaetota bacterium]